MGMRQLQLQCLGLCTEITPHNQPTPNHVLHLVLSLFTGHLGDSLDRGRVLAPKATCVRCGHQCHPTTVLALTIIKGMLTLPRTAQGGVMNFTDLAPEDGDPYRS